MARWPRLAGKVRWEHGARGDLRRVTADPGELVVAVHACGPLTDRVLDTALAARAAVAVLPCCHSLARCDTAGLEAWMAGDLAVDAVRALRLRAAGYRVHLQTIPVAITPQNRLLLGVPAALSGAPLGVRSPGTAARGVVAPWARSETTTGGRRPGDAALGRVE